MKFHKTTTLLLILLLTTAILYPAIGQARPQFAQRTGRVCGQCHVATMGGGPLNAEGKAFRKTIVSTGERFLHLALYFLHVPFGVAWVGFFLFTFTPAIRRHALLIPPKAYIRQLVYSMIIIALSGPYIALIRARLTPGIFQTNFGVLLMVKIAAVLALLISTIALVWHSTVRLRRRYKTLLKTFESGEALELTAADLALFNGTGKQKAFVAVDGKIFDVTDRNLWSKGSHPGGHKAGFDLTAAFAGAPHGKEVFDRIPSVGSLVDDPTTGKGGLKWALFLGTAAGVAILIIIAMWRWV